MTIPDNQISNDHISKIKDKEILKAIENSMNKADQVLKSRKHIRKNRVYLFVIIILIIFVSIIS